MVGFGVRGAEDGMMDRMRGSRVRLIFRGGAREEGSEMDWRAGVKFSITMERSGEEWTGGDDWRE